MSLHLFRGGTWDGRVEEVAPLPHVVVPYVNRGLTTGFEAASERWNAEYGQHLYTGTRYVVQVDHPCIPFVRVAEQWIVYTYGELPTPDRVLRQLRRLDVPIERFSWRGELARGDVPWWVEIP